VPQRLFQITVGRFDPAKRDLFIGFVLSGWNLVIELEDAYEPLPCSE
jgi:hypothetical protein